MFTSLFRFLETLKKGLASSPNSSYLMNASIFQFLIFLKKNEITKTKQRLTILIMWLYIWDIICDCTSCYCKGWWGVTGVLFAGLVKIMSGNLKTWKWGYGEGSVYITHYVIALIILLFGNVLSLFDAFNAVKPQFCSLTKA